MKAKLGIAVMILGSVLIASALGLFIHNEMEEKRAGESAEILMPQIVDAINERQKTADVRNPEETVDAAVSVPFIPDEVQEAREMTVVDIDGYGYVGFVGMPALGLELPVMSDWSYPQLQIAPCRYTGGTHGDDIVIMAHNYDRHFGRISDLQIGDTVTFTDMDGETIEYEVVARDILDPRAIEEMTAGDYDLTLFTCTYGGQSRVTVRCDRII